MTSGSPLALCALILTHGHSLVLSWHFLALSGSRCVPWHSLASILCCSLALFDVSSPCFVQKPQEKPLFKNLRKNPWVVSGCLWPLFGSLWHFIGSLWPFSLYLHPLKTSSKDSCQKPEENWVVFLSVWHFSALWLSLCVLENL